MNCHHKKRLAVAVNEAWRSVHLAHASYRSRSRWIKGGLAVSVALGYSAAQAADPQNAAAPTAASAPAATTHATGHAAGASAASSASSAEIAPGVTQLEAVTVTADKRVERAIDVPQSVATVSGKAMVEAHRSNLGDYLNGVPGVIVSPSGTKDTITVRGLSTGGVSNPTTAVLIDDVPVNASTQIAEGGEVVPNLDPGDIQNIEVLRGPQGTLYGAASLGGLVKYTTIDPDVTKLGAQFQADVNAVDHGGVGDAQRVAVNIPLVTDTAAVRISAFNRWDAGYTRNVNDGSTDNGSVRTQGGRIAGLFYISDKVTVRSSLMLQNQYFHGAGGEDWGPNLQPLYGDYANSRIPGSSYSSLNYALFTTSVSADLGWAQLTSTTGFSDGRYGLGLDMTPSFGFIAQAAGLKGYGAVLTQHDQTEKFTQEVRLESPQDGRKLEWRVGAFFTNEVSDVDQSINFTNITTGQQLPHGFITGTNADSRYQEVAGFASIRYHFTDRFDVQVGGRYARNNQLFHITGGNPFDGSSGDGTFSYLISPRYRITQDWMVYARVANGYRPGGANTLPVPNTASTYGPDKDVSYELGTKGEFLNKRLMVDLSVYHITWDNIQLTANDPTTGFGYTVNSGGAKSDGVEAALTGRPWAGMTVRASVGYTRAVLTQNTPNGLFGLTGDALPDSAKWTATLGLRQAYTLPAGIKGFASGTLTFIGNRAQDFTTSSKLMRLNAPAYATVDLATGLSKDDWTIVAYIRNLTDRRGLNALSYEDQIRYAPIYGASLIQPRTIGVTLTKSF